MNKHDTAQFTPRASFCTVRTFWLHVVVSFGKENGLVAALRRGGQTAQRDILVFLKARQYVLGVLWFYLIAEKSKHHCTSDCESIIITPAHDSTIFFSPQIHSECRSRHICTVHLHEHSNRRRRICTNTCSLKVSNERSKQKIWILFYLSPHKKQSVPKLYSTLANSPSPQSVGAAVELDIIFFLFHRSFVEIPESLEPKQAIPVLSPSPPSLTIKRDGGRGCSVEEDRISTVAAVAL
ncbi:uncharacterized protein MYCFIDRAFT_176644 [Pseudocercospora fijiensis CIRAD86]|uniref:Uncharacterized protein n=1 Tax=Pseudocercospora fijiensis (strain CIRAD86) TaxID=383855 RepID=M3AV52_PSEFD|nr:uncharacterized protein MYCFIDRAFT_176644 [Pseudocercospora fijiensis CIRAD86]EME81362.1 hypothetical protein MYCFIDRAFT_176644 [Pseudocercospora fijiensis CIRAD86]